MTRRGSGEQRGWTDTAIIKTSSRIDVPGNRAVISAGPITIGGIAFAGDRGIAKVEVSTDDGKTWDQATITENPSPAGLSWVYWELPWTPSSGAYTLVVRATDGDGALQTETTGCRNCPMGHQATTASRLVWHKFSGGSPDTADTM